MLHPKKINSKTDKLQEKLIEEKLIEEKLIEEKQEIIDRNKNKSGEKRKRRFHRNYKNGKRSYFGLQNIDLLSEPSILTLENSFEESKKNIKKFVKKYLNNRSLDPFKYKVIVKEFQREGYAELTEEYKSLYTAHKALKANLKAAKKYEYHRNKWKDCKEQDPKPSKSMSRKVADIIVKDAIPKGAKKLPVVGQFANMGFMTYKNLKSSLHEAKDETQNLLMGTRQKMAIGRLVSMAAGSSIGAAGMGVTLALASSFVPAIGTATGGIVGIVLGSTFGAAAGGVMGLTVFNELSKKSTRLKNEILYEMDYKHLKNLRKKYGFDENAILNMYAYLNNQIKVHGPKSETGKDLRMLRKSALEKGNQNALIKLCVYFIGQEQILRAVLYNMGVDSIIYQKEKAELLNKKRACELNKPSHEKILSYEEKLNDNLFIKELYLLKKKYNLNKPYTYFIEIFQSYPTNKKTKDEEKYKKQINKELKFTEEDLNAFIKLMLDSEMQNPENISYFMMLHSKLGEPVLEQWEKEQTLIKESIHNNEEQILKTQRQKNEIEYTRELIVTLLEEFQNPSELKKIKQRWIYGDMKKNKYFDDPIKALFDPVQNNQGEILKKTIGEEDHLREVNIFKPKDIRTFGLNDYAVINIDALEKLKSEFREDMRENAFQYAMEEAQQYDETFWIEGLESFKRTEYRSLVCEKSDINSLEDFFNIIDKEIPQLIHQLNTNELENATDLNQKCKNIIFAMKKTEQNIPELSKSIHPKIEALKDIQFYLDYASIRNVYARRDLAHLHQSPLQDLFPYTPHGMVEHLKKDGEWIHKDQVRTEAIQRMKETKQTPLTEKNSHAHIQKTKSISALLRETSPITFSFPLTLSPRSDAYATSTLSDRAITSAFSEKKKNTGKIDYFAKKALKNKIPPLSIPEPIELKNRQKYK